MQIEVLLDETMVLAQAQAGAGVTGGDGRAPRPAAGSSAPPVRGPSSYPPARSASSAPPPRASIRPDIPRINVEQDDADAATTIFRDPLEQAQLEELKRRLRGELGGEHDPNQTLEYQRIRAVQLEELEGLLKGTPGQPDANTTIQLDVIDDGKLDELEASLEVEKRNRGVRRMSPVVGETRAEPTPTGSRRSQRGMVRDLDADMFSGLWRDVVTAWRFVARLARRVAAGVKAAFQRMTGGDPRAVLPLAGPDDTVPPMSGRAKRRFRGK